MSISRRDIQSSREPRSNPWGAKSESWVSRGRGRGRGGPRSLSKAARGEQRRGRARSVQYTRGRAGLVSNLPALTRAMVPPSNQGGNGRGRGNGSGRGGRFSEDRLKVQEARLQDREGKLKKLEEELNTRKQQLDEREKRLEDKELELFARERKVEEKERKINEQEKTMINNSIPISHSPSSTSILPLSMGPPSAPLGDLVSNITESGYGSMPSMDGVESTTEKYEGGGYEGYEGSGYEGNGYSGRSTGYEGGFSPPPPLPTFGDVPLEGVLISNLPNIKSPTTGRRDTRQQFTGTPKIPDVKPPRLPTSPPPQQQLPLPPKEQKSLMPDDLYAPIPSFNEKIKPTTTKNNTTGSNNMYGRGSISRGGSLSSSTRDKKIYTSLPDSFGAEITGGGSAGGGVDDYYSTMDEHSTSSLIYSSSMGRSAGRGTSTQYTELNHSMFVQSMGSLSTTSSRKSPPPREEEDTIYGTLPDFSKFNAKPAVQQSKGGGRGGGGGVGSTNTRIGGGEGDFSPFPGITHHGYKDTKKDDIFAPIPQELTGKKKKSSKSKRFGRRK